MLALYDNFSTIIIFLITAVVFVTAYVRYAYGYWKKKNIPYLEPIFPYGNSDFFLPRGIFIGVLSRSLYDQVRNKGYKVAGVYMGLQPYLVVCDPEWTKDILMRDFQSFTERGVYTNEREPLSINLFSQKGQDWKNSRLKLTPIFTSAKLKAMFETMVDCSGGLKMKLEELEAKKSDVDMLEMAACFTTDVIGSCAFGIDCNSFKYPDAEFRTIGRKFFTEFSLSDRVNILLTMCAPDLAKKLHARIIQKDVSRFFLNIVTDTVSYREKNNYRRNDLLQLLIDMKNSNVNLSMNELVGQVFLFFMAGFETSSSTINFTLFEISKNEEVQDRVRKEMLEVLSRHDDKITYEAIAEMKYLGQAVDETLRLWPPLVTINRKATKDYTFRDSNITIEKGTLILISALGVHHDPEYWPDPLKWDPDRFSDENKEKRHLMTYLPFGEGPRNCIGMRLGLLQTKIALVTILSKYKVTLSSKTVTPLGIDPDSVSLRTLNRVYLQLEKI